MSKNHRRNLWQTSWGSTVIARCSEPRTLWRLLPAARCGNYVVISDVCCACFVFFLGGEDENDDDDDDNDDDDDDDGDDRGDGGDDDDNEGMRAIFVYCCFCIIIISMISIVLCTIITISLWWLCRSFLHKDAEHMFKDVMQHDLMLPLPHLLSR